MHIIELKRADALLIPDIQQLLKRAVESDTMVAPAGIDSVARDLFNFVTDDMQFMFLGAEDGRMKAVMLGFYPVGNMFPYPTLVLYYNEGSKALSRGMQEFALDTISERGYTRLLAVNTSRWPDGVWLRGLTPEGAASEIVGSLAVFEVK